MFWMVVTVGHEQHCIRQSVGHSQDSSGTRIFTRELQSFAKFLTLLWFLVDDGPSLEADQVMDMPQ